MARVQSATARSHCSSFSYASARLASSVAPFVAGVTALVYAATARFQLLTAAYRSPMAVAASG